MIDTAQSLGSAYHVVIEKVYLCSGLDGYVPKFDPSVNEFGCLADSPNLLYRFKILVCCIGLYIGFFECDRTSRRRFLVGWMW